MLRHIWVETTCFDRNDDREQTERDLMWFLEALTQRNQDYLKQRPSTPRLYRSGVYWSAPKQLEGECEEVKVLSDAIGPKRSGTVQRTLDKVQDVLGGEHFCDIGVILELGTIDCDGLACWRAAELRQMGIPAKPFMTSRKRLDGGTTYHALVIWPPMIGCNYETSEDPSLLLGMHQPERASDRIIEIQKNAERADILRRHGLAAVLGPDAPASDDGFDAAVEDLMGARRAAKKIRRRA